MPLILTLNPTPQGARHVEFHPCKVLNWMPSAEGMRQRDLAWSCAGSAGPRVHDASPEPLMRRIAMRTLMPEHRHFITRHVNRRLDDPECAIVAYQTRRQHRHEVRAREDGPHEQ